LLNRQLRDRIPVHVEAPDGNVDLPVHRIADGPAEPRPHLFALVVLDALDGPDLGQRVLADAREPGLIEVGLNDPGPDVAVVVVLDVVGENVVVEGTVQPGRLAGLPGYPVGAGPDGADESVG